MADNAQAKKLRAAIVEVAENELSKQPKEGAPKKYQQYGLSSRVVYDRGVFIDEILNKENIQDIKQRKSRKKAIEEDIDNTSNYLSGFGVKNAWCKQFIVTICMPQAEKKVGKTTRIANGGYAAMNYKTITGEGPSYKYPVTGMIYCREGDDSSTNSTSGHVGIVVGVNYDSGSIITIEGNAGQSVSKIEYTADKLKKQKAYFYRCWDEDDTSLIESAGGQNNVDKFQNAVNNAPDTKNIYGKTLKGNKNYPSNSSSTSDPGTSSSEKQPFEIPYMTVAEATDYLKNLSNPNQGNGNGSTTGSIPTTSIPTQS